jgi:hypothetical protein
MCPAAAGERDHLGVCGVLIDLSQYPAPHRAPAACGKPAT